MEVFAPSRAELTRHDLNLAEYDTLVGSARAPISWLHDSFSGDVSRESSLSWMNRDIQRTDQAHMHRQGHAYHASPCTQR